ncbi:sensor histidine kinase [Clostridium sp. Marseille-P2415]|uniref:sensor histidine kinase n=1 Tax=Clostridium sp. Marseille-P2415 TaxID=1805471 RepID=UPI001356370F|nr:sensor histidine kinase [Clostridium sp. Marseille-P2415]
MKYKRDSIKAKIRSMQAIVFIPVIIMIGILLYMMAWQNKQYRQSIRNLTMATEFNFDFKSNIDYKMYRIVIGADTFDTLNPYEDLENSRKIFEQLKDSTPQETSKKGLDGILVLIGILEKRIEDIRTSSIFGDYDRNMERLDKDIYVITDLIEESMSDYIYNETKTLESMRQKLDAKIRQVMALCIVVSAYIIVFLMASFSSFGKKITKPIEELCEYTMELAGGSLKVNAPKSNIREIRMLSDQYDQMVVRIGELIEHNKEEQELKRKTELKLLQAQINPHFLYNTLDTIVWLAEGKRHQDVVDMITALSSFLRIGLNNGRDFITIRGEAEHVNSYLQIQHFRYEDIMDYEIDFEEQIMEYSILKLTLQPIVENALYHGIKNCRKKGFLKITGRQENEDIFLRVEDNGIGMKPEELGKMQKQVSRGGEDVDLREGFGIANVAERIRLNFGDSYGLHIESEYGVGTSVTVRIPAVLKGNK